MPPRLVSRSSKSALECRHLLLLALGVTLRMGFTMRAKKATAKKATAKKATAKKATAKKATAKKATAKKATAKKATAKNRAEPIEVKRLFRTLRGLLATVDDAESAAGYEADEDWAFADWREQEDDLNEDVIALDDAIERATAVAMKLKALRLEPMLIQESAECMEAYGYSFLGRAQKEFRFGAHSFAKWSEQFVLEGQAVGMGLSHMDLEPEGDPLPWSFLEALGFTPERYVPGSYGAAESWAEEWGCLTSEDE
jgi:hypothetical protein